MDDWSSSGRTGPAAVAGKLPSCRSQAEELDGQADLG